MKRPPEFEYSKYYKSLIGTKYESKCPDLNVDGESYEHERFISNNPKNAFRNMIKDGLLQSNRLVIDKPNLTERFMQRELYNRINNGEDIEEIWLRYQDGEIKLLFKKTDGQQLLLTPAVEESVVISYGILIAKVWNYAILCKFHNSIFQ